MTASNKQYDLWTATIRNVDRNPVDEEEIKRLFPNSQDFVKEKDGWTTCMLAITLPDTLSYLKLRVDDYIIQIEGA